MPVYRNQDLGFSHIGTENEPFRENMPWLGVSLGDLGWRLASWSEPMPRSFFPWQFLRKNMMNFLLWFFWVCLCLSEGRGHWGYLSAVRKIPWDPQSPPALENLVTCEPLAPHLLTQLHRVQGSIFHSSCLPHSKVLRVKNLQPRGSWTQNLLCLKMSSQAYNVLSEKIKQLFPLREGACFKSQKWCVSFNKSPQWQLWSRPPLVWN